MKQDIADKLRDAFEAMDHKKFFSLLRDIDLEQPMPDGEIVTIAVSLLSSESLEDRKSAEELLGRLQNDGTVPAADVAYARAFLKYELGDATGLLEELLPFLDDSDTTLGGQMRLLAAEALVELERFDEVRGVLKPLLEPPGTEGTLGAHFILLESILYKGNADRNKLIEIASVIDLLLERGHRLGNALNVVHCTKLLWKHGIEGIIERLLNCHAEELEGYTDFSEDSITMLLEVGEKLKVPVAVRCAGASYRERPFSWHEPSGDHAAYLFSSHEEHEAARLSILKSYSKKKIKNERDIWGPFLLYSYYSGSWKETLNLIWDKRHALRDLDIFSNISKVRAVCEYNLGRHEEAVKRIEELGLSFYLEAEPLEAMVHPAGLAALGRIDDLKGSVELMMKVRGDDPSYIVNFLSSAVDEILFRSYREALLPWIKIVLVNVPERTKIIKVLFTVMLSWGEWRIAEYIKEKIGEEDESAGLLAEARLAAATGKASEAEELYARLENDRNADPAWRPCRARDRRRCGNVEGAREDALYIVEKTEVDVHHAAAHAILAGTNMAGATLKDKEVMAQIQTAATIAGQVASSDADRQGILSQVWEDSFGHHPEGLLSSLDMVMEAQPGSVEVLRLARLIAGTYDATDEQRDKALKIRRAWESANFRTG